MILSTRFRSRRPFLIFPYWKEKLKYVWTIILISTFSFQVKAQEPIVTDGFYKIKGTENVNTIISTLNSSSISFQQESNNRINYGVVGNEFKYFLIKTQASKGVVERELSIDNTSLDTISIYKIDKDLKSVLLYQAGALIPYKRDRAFVWHTVHLSITTAPSYYLVAMKAPQKNINVTYEIIRSDQLHRKYQAHDRVVWFYIGVVFIIVVIIALAWYLFRRKAFIIYLGYISCISLWIFSHYGYAFSLLYPRVPILNEIIKPISSLGAGYFLILLSRKVFQQKLGSQSWLRKILKGLEYLLLLLIASMLLLLFHNLSPQTRTNLMVVWHIGLLSSISLITFTSIYFIHAGRASKIFSLAMAIVCIMSLMQLLSNSGYINNYFINEHGITLASILQNFVIAFSLFYSLLEENNEKKKQVITLQHDKTETLQKLVTLQDDERKRIANDLHDNLGPLLAAIKINFSRLINNKDELQNGLAGKTEKIIEDSISEIRNVAHNLVPKGLTSKGLIHAVDEYFENIQPAYNKKITFTHDVHSIPSPGIQANIYRIICELVLNAAKHSDAEELKIFVGSNDKTITVSIQDNGKGFDLKTADFTKSFGLQSAENRINYMNGKFVLKTAPGQGTLIDMEIPLQPHQP